MTLTFTVPGEAVPQGSKNAYARGNRIVLVESSSKLPAWRRTVAVHAKAALLDDGFDGPVHVRVTFHMRAPHRRTTTWPTKRPDLDKLVRAILDALTVAGVWADDSQVVTLTARKVWALAEPHTDITVEAIEP